MKKKLLALLMGTSLVLAACGGGDDAAEDKDTATNGGGETTTDTADAGDAQKLYEQKCSSCHGANLEGGVGPALDKIGASLSQEDIENTIANGKGAMPKGLLQGEEASAVASWLAGKK
ncbi:MULTISPECIES: cytochrome c551 [Bacillales]|uniref:Cytochrome C551 n=4 Tax=Bacillales TaxID=1385 RepID=A0A160MFY7_9BACI|nr:MULTISPECIES: cytochrome c [Bacillales]MDM5228427.1 c-type cytochrome [Cytobacillus sp. NJ13]AND42196.1 cytochrome C551 [Cytobacillus oceanisediminis 2691]KON86312.1 cytochrome C551 [Sporosarcina globispora]MBN8201582.1 c-type cytochrome [Bacillus sp. NTK034]MBU8771554.1 c-type cytochrome [Cytobacillus oceanisediminis]